MSERMSRANGRRSKVRAAIEHVFARQKGPMALFERTIGIVRAKTKIAIANLAYNLTRFVWYGGELRPRDTGRRRRRASNAQRPTELEVRPSTTALRYPRRRGEAAISGFSR